MRIIGQCTQVDLKAVSALIVEEWEKPENRGKDLKYEDFEPFLSKKARIAWLVVAHLLVRNGMECVKHLREVLAWGNEAGEMKTFEYKLMPNTPSEIKEKLWIICRR